MSYTWFNNQARKTENGCYTKTGEAKPTKNKEREGKKTDMTEAEKKKRAEYDREAGILAHSIAAQVAAVDHITYYGALNILDHAKGILENEMKKQRPTVPTEIRDRWGNIIETTGEAPVG